jgi:hypothetical protein
VSRQAPPAPGVCIAHATELGEEIGVEIAFPDGLDVDASGLDDIGLERPDDIGLERPDDDVPDVEAAELDAI